jgi:hypothetical protein
MYCSTCKQEYKNMPQHLKTDKHRDNEISNMSTTLSSLKLEKEENKSVKLEKKVKKLQAEKKKKV